MTDRQAPPRPRRALLPLGIVLLISAALIVPDQALSGLVRLDDPGGPAGGELRALIRSLPESPLVLVGFDPDLGTYAEIRPAVRAMLDDLFSHEARIGIVSFSPEGRALAVAEIDRLRRAGFADDRLVDLGYRSGAEAGLIQAIELVVPDAERGLVANGIRIAGGGLDAFDLVLLVGGTDFGPRAWVEQILPRLPDLRLAAIAPTVLGPELAPYRRTRQLIALVATLRDNAAYAERVRDGPAAPPDTSGGDRPADAAAMLVGLLVTLGILGETLLRRAAWRPPGPRL
jgi:hypothetical protein